MKDKKQEVKQPEITNVDTTSHKEAFEEVMAKIQSFNEDLIINHGMALSAYLNPVIYAVPVSKEDREEVRSNVANRKTVDVSPIVLP